MVINTRIISRNFFIISPRYPMWVGDFQLCACANLEGLFSLSRWIFRLNLSVLVGRPRSLRNGIVILEVEFEFMVALFTLKLLF